MIYQDLWLEMENSAPPGGQGYLQRRIEPESPLDLYVATEKPSNRRMLLLELPGEMVGSLTVPRETQGFEIKLSPPTSNNRALLVLRLLNRAYTDIFSSLVADLIVVTGSAADEREAVRLFLLRLEAWQRFLAHSGPEGLGQQAQQGLFGELWMLHRLVAGVVPVREAVQAWTGPTGTPQDFQFAGGVIEVKTTSVRSPVLVQISSERQLDDTGVDALFLVHLSVDLRRASGVSLPALIDNLRDCVRSHESAVALFEQRLFDAGYSDLHRERYMETGYVFRGVEAYRVRDGFPRITAAMIPVGTGNVRYFLATDACASFAVGIEAIEERIGGTPA